MLEVWQIGHDPSHHLAVLEVPERLGHDAHPAAGALQDEADLAIAKDGYDGVNHGSHAGAGQ